MKQSAKDKYKLAVGTPEVPIFLPGEVAKILNYSSVTNVRRFDIFIKVKKNKNGFRFYSYNDIKYLKVLKKLIDAKMPFAMLDSLMKFQANKGVDPVEFIKEFSKYYTTKTYNENKKKK